MQSDTSARLSVRKSRSSPSRSTRKVFQRALTYQVRARARGVDEGGESGVFEEDGNAMDMIKLASIADSRSAHSLI